MGWCVHILTSTKYAEEIQQKHLFYSTSICVHLCTQYGKQNFLPKFSQYDMLRLVRVQVAKKSDIHEQLRCIVHSTINMECKLLLLKSHKCIHKCIICTSNVRSDIYTQWNLPWSPSQLHLSVCLVMAGDDPLLHWTICLIGLQVNALFFVTFDLIGNSRHIHFLIWGHWWVWCGGRLAPPSSDEVEKECSQETSNSEGDHTTQYSCDGYCSSAAELLKIFCVTTWIWCT